MSWRIVLEPAHFGETLGDVAGADVVVPRGATEEEVAGIAHEWAWKLPLSIWAPSRDDPRLLHLLKTLEEDHHQEVPEDRIHVKEPEQCALR